jgi:hypothetical protein
MKNTFKMAVLGCTALSLMVSSTAALAVNIDEDGDDLDAVSTPQTNVEDKTPQEVCDDILKPNNPNSKFSTEPVSVVVGAWVNDGPAYADDAAGAAYGTGTLVYTDIVAGASGGFFRNGGSPNVWGTAEAAGSHWTQTGQLFNFYVDQTRTTTFGCRVWKYNGPLHNHLVQPPGLQSSGNSALEHQEHIYVNTHEVVTEDDFPGSGGGPVNTLICISPNNTTKAKPGDWKKMHGFTGSCTAASTAAGTNFIPSNNNPIAD